MRSEHGGIQKKRQLDHHRYDPVFSDAEINLEQRVRMLTVFCARLETSLVFLFLIERIHQVTQEPLSQRDRNGKGRESWLVNIGFVM